MVMSPTLLDNAPKQHDSGPGTRDSGLRVPAEGAADEVDAFPNPAAAAMLPAELLQPGEIIILLLKPSPWFIVLVPMKMLIGIALGTGVLAALQGMAPIGFSQQQIVVLGFALGGVRVFWQFLEWLSRVYVLTDQRVIRVMGVLRISIFETPLQRIQHTEIVVSVRERLLGLGSIAFATSGTGGYEAYWLMIQKPLEVHQKIVQTLNRYRR